MKIRLFAIATLLTLISFASTAQEIKIGYIKLEKVFDEWPETERANTELQNYEAQLDSRLQAKINDFQTKLANYQQTAANMDAVTRKDAETEIENLQAQIEEFETNAQQSISAKNLALLNPIQDKLKQTIDQVAKENGYTHIFTYGTSLVFTSDKTGDISFKVAQKLGFTLSPDTP